MSEKLIKTDGVEIATQAFGNPADEPVLLVMGVMASMLWWPDEFCERLAAQGRYVIRYDNRDTGLSTTYAPGKAPYSFDDLADDAGRVLDAYGFRSAHVVGMSMGGMIAQRLALRRPERVRTLTIIDSTPIFFDVSHLPGTAPEYMEHSDSGANVDWTNRAQVIDFIVRDVEAIAGTAFPHDISAGQRVLNCSSEHGLHVRVQADSFLIRRRIQGCVKRLWDPNQKLTAERIERRVAAWGGRDLKAA